MIRHDNSEALDMPGPDCKKVGENLDRHGPSSNHYALLKRGGKQFRQSLEDHWRTPKPLSGGRWGSPLACRFTVTPAQRIDDFGAVVNRQT